ncbi:MAG: D-cysteine desulfhydrase family protein [Clostridiales bacterium]|nr:D-cysteine desulfhydrase family protein [Clostridiales bacterium]
MPYSTNEVRALLAKKAKYELGFFPTPLHRLDRLSEEFHVDLYMKRDDFSGRNLFGGNKIRKLEYLMGEAVKSGAEYVFTYGATESNHAMQTVTACRRVGLKPIIYLTAVVPVDEQDIRSNLLLDQIMGAEIHIVRLRPGETEDDGDARGEALAAVRRKELEEQGHRCYNIPMGGANALGSLGFVEGYVEMTEQLATIGREANYIFHATGTAGTMAGLDAGRKLLGARTQVISVNVSPKDDTYRVRAAALANSALDELSVTDVRLDPETDTWQEKNFYLPGYEKPSPESTKAIRYLSEQEGIFVDPVYSGKAFAALLSWLRTGKIPAGSTVVFWHTGGATALFAEQEIVGDFYQKLIYED